MASSTTKYWLLKAEPDSRIVKGKDVKFSVDDFERVGTSPWEGVRNYEARNLMKEMKTGDRTLFYHSSCKVPGIAAFAEVTKEAYPDHTAWDPTHPYFDEKSKIDDPKWFMVDLTFRVRATNFVPLALLRVITDLPDDTLPDSIAYIGTDGIRALQGMDLVRKGRLSVQRVREDAYRAVCLLAEKGGWDNALLKPKKRPGKGKEKEQASASESPDPAPTTSAKSRARKRKVKDEEEQDADDVEEVPPAKHQRLSIDTASIPTNGSLGLRRSSRKR